MVKKKGDFVNTGDILCEVETDKAVMEYESPFSGILLDILVEEGTQVKVGKLIALIGKKEEIYQKKENLNQEFNINKDRKEYIKSVEIIEKEEKSNQKEYKEDIGNRVKISPFAKKFAKENKINPLHIKGTGPNNRIIKKDLEGIQSEKEDNLVTKDIFLKVSAKRRVIANRLLLAKKNIPHYYLGISILMKNLINYRKKYNTDGKRFSLNSYLIKLLGNVLSRHPRLNSTWGEDEICLFSRIDISIAVAQDDGGLITPIIRDVLSKSIMQVDKELIDLIKRAKTGKLHFDEYNNATFSISSLAAYGIEWFTSIINPPMSAILSIGSIENKLTVYKKNKIKITPIMKITLSCDHRVIDGIISSKFLKDLKRTMENPSENQFI